jgi:hypothetical protein
MTPSEIIIAAYEAGTITWEQIAEAFDEDASDWDGFEEYREYLNDSPATACRVQELGLGADIGDAVTAAREQAERIMRAQTVRGVPGRSY